jgi:phosphomevalonate kinase
MKAFAPGKLVLTGAYAVLEGAPAIVMATSRGATADTSRVQPTPTLEVRAAIGESPAPHVDASALFIGGRKLGLGASAAILVSSLAARELAEKHVDLADKRVRDALFARARAAHASAQQGGSGVDVAASVYGGVLRYTIDGGSPSHVALPDGTHVAVFACGTSARTSDLRAQVAGAPKSVYHACIAELSTIAGYAANAVERGDRPALILAVRRAARGLARLGAAASAPIVPAGFDTLEEEALRDDAAFCVAGAGGGDVAVHVGHAAPTKQFLERAHSLGLFLLDIDCDEKGVRVARESATHAAEPAASARS